VASLKKRKGFLFLGKLKSTMIVVVTRVGISPLKTRMPKSPRVLSMLQRRNFRCLRRMTQPTYGYPMSFDELSTVSKNLISIRCLSSICTSVF
jgi:hypothetical protein